MTARHGPLDAATNISGDGVDVEQLYREYGRRVLAYALRRTTAREDALDVVAETFVVAWRRRHHIPRDAEGHLPWLLATARNCALNVNRDGRRVDQVIASVARELDVSTVPDPAQVHQSRATNKELSEALAALPVDDRELVLLVSWDGLSPTAAGTVLGLNPGNARVRLHRARARLRAALAAADNAPAVSPSSQRLKRGTS